MCDPITPRPSTGSRAPFCTQIPGVLRGDIVILSAVRSCGGEVPINLDFTIQEERGGENTNIAVIPLRCSLLFHITHTHTHSLSLSGLALTFFLPFYFIFDKQSLITLDESNFFFYAVLLRF